MDTFLKAAACSIIVLLLCIILGKQGKDFSMILTVGGCCMIAILAVSYLQPVVSLVERLRSIGNLNPELITIVIKAVGIAIIGEITCLICADCGNAALGKALQLLSTVVILWQSIPLFNGLIELVEKILVFE